MMNQSGGGNLHPNVMAGFNDPEYFRQQHAFPRYNVPTHHGSAAGRRAEYHRCRGDEDYEQNGYDGYGRR
jgi:hypothetical protein